MSDVSPPAMDITPTAFAIADSTGRIVATGVVPAHMVAAQTAPTGGVVANGAAHIESHWITGGAITPRPANPTALAGTVLSNVPNPSTVTINGTAYTVTDGELDMTFPAAGAYAITVASPFPYLDGAFSITQ